MSRKALLRYIAGCYLLGLLLALLYMVYTVLGTGSEDYYNPAFCGVRGGEKGICDFDVEVALIYMIYVPFFIAPPFVLPGFIIYIASRLWGRCRRKPAASALDADPGRLTATMSSQGRLATAGSASLRPLLWYITGCFSFGLLLALYSIVSMLLGKGFYGVESIGEYYDRDLCNVVPGNEGLIPTYPGYSCDINLKYAYLHLVYFAVTFGVPLSLLGLVFYFASRFALRLKGRYSGRSRNRDTQW